MKPKEIGKNAESVAEAYLKQKDYEIVCRNFSTRCGEIDIIAAHGGYLIFVEVKFRSNCEYGAPLEAVTRAKIKRITQTASEYLNKFRIFDTDIRFDVVTICAETDEIEHIENAFDTYLTVD